jgi:hypothetical protein
VWLWHTHNTNQFAVLLCVNHWGIIVYSDWHVRELNVLLQGAVYNEDRCSYACLRCVDLCKKINKCVCVVVVASEAEETHSQKGEAEIDECH